GYVLQVGPSPDLDGGPLDPLPNYDQLPPPTSAQPAVSVDLPPVATVQGVVVDSGGAPVAGARVYARSDQMPWSLSRSAVTAADGSYSLPLRAGAFLVEAAPVTAADAPAVSGEQSLTLPVAGATLNLVCLRKVRGFGLIVRPGGGAASANYQI